MLCLLLVAAITLIQPAPAAAQGYYYPPQPAYPPGYQYYPRQPQYPQYPQHGQQPRQAPPQQGRPAYQPDPRPGQPGQPQPQRRSQPKDTSGDAPTTADVSSIDQDQLTTYTWDARDTLGDLARASGVSNSQILALNQLSVSQLRSGQVLRVPRLAQTTPSLDIARDPQAQMAREVWRGVRGKKQVALTFDAGGVSDALDDLLRNLTAAEAPATFFVTGQFARDHKESLQKIHEAGFPVYNHSWSHPEFKSLTEAEMAEELSKADEAISSITGRSTKPYWRPPFGNRDQRVLKATAAEGYLSVYWTHDSHDSIGEKKSAQFVVDRVLNPPNAKANPDGYLDGGIILMHVGEQGTADAIPEIVSGLKSRGFTLVTVEQILQP